MIAHGLDPGMRGESPRRKKPEFVQNWQISSGARNGARSDYYYDNILKGPSTGFPVRRSLGPSSPGGGVEGEPRRLAEAAFPGAWPGAILRRGIGNRTAGVCAEDES
jgi:hypothetical protein